MKCKHDWVRWIDTNNGRPFCLRCSMEKSEFDKLSKIAKKALRNELGEFTLPNGRRTPTKKQQEKYDKQVLSGWKVEDTSVSGRLERIENRLDVHAKQIRDLQLIVQKQEK
jgi:hypothetical protein